MRSRFVSFLLCGLAIASSANAQNPPAPPPPPAGVFGGNVGHVVADMGRSVVFYRDVLGLSVITDGNPPWAGDDLRAANVSTVPVPGGQWGIELVKMASPAAAFQPRMQDPGALTLIFFVRDLESIVTRARIGNYPVVTTGGVAGVGNNGAIKATVIQGPDGEFIELLQPPPPAPPAAPAPGAAPAAAAAPPSGPPTNVIRGNVRFSVADANAAARTYEGLLGVQMRGGPAPVADPGVPFMLGQPGATFHLRMAQLPASGMTIELLEIAGPEKAKATAVRNAPGISYLRVGLSPERMRAAGTLTNPENAFLILSPAQP